MSGGARGRRGARLAAALVTALVAALITVGLTALVAPGLAAAGAPADPATTEADARFHAALTLAARDRDAAIAALEALGAATPPTIWTDDAWAEAARLAEARRDYPRASADLDQVIAHGDDAALIGRARADRARLGAMIGDRGQWSELAARHDALRAALAGGGDPRPALADLGHLVDDHPGYPRATDARLELAAAWERAGDPDRARAALDAAIAGGDARDRRRARLARARLAIRQAAFDAAAADLADLAADPAADRVVVAAARADLATAGRRARWRVAVAVALALLVAFAIGALRRARGSWPAALRALLPPPGEVLYAAPIALVLAVVASAGNPLVGRAVRVIAGGGVAIAWLSGAVAAATPRRGLARSVLHAACAAVAAAALVYLALGRDRMIDLVVETWREGPAAR